ncbi:MAG: hypothetical protein ACYDA9_19050, partial [Terriglobia bacterium]
GIVTAALRRHCCSVKLTGRKERWRDKPAVTHPHHELIADEHSAGTGNFQVEAALRRHCDEAGIVTAALRRHCCSVKLTGRKERWRDKPAVTHPHHELIADEHSAGAGNFQIAADFADQKLVDFIVAGQYRNFLRLMSPKIYFQKCAILKAYFILDKQLLL